MQPTSVVQPAGAAAGPGPSASASAHSSSGSGSRLKAAAHRHSTIGIGAAAAAAAQPRSLPRDDTHANPPSTVAASAGLRRAQSGRLVYARPQDLPSFPSLGVKPNGSAASAAATLGWTSTSSPSLWQPDKSASASAAAVLAKDYKMTSAWAPAPSSHGAKAALLAHQAARSSDKAKPLPATHGQSAATIAFNSDRQAARGSDTAAVDHRRSLHAAQGAMSTANRRRARSSPTPRETYPDEANAASNALAAATRAHKSPASPAKPDNAGAVPYVTMNPSMFTSHPPVKPETDEQKKADVLHASAVAMAKKMYTQQQKMIEAKMARAEASSGRGRATSRDSISDDDEPAMTFGSLQDAAYKQAQDRLAKIHEDNLKNREYQDYYGAKSPQRRFTMNKLRRRASAEGTAVEDQAQSQQIRNQMSIFSSKLSQVDSQKRQHDRDALLAAAQKNVQAKLKGMDDKISAETGMVPPSTLTQWELKAHAAAQSRSASRVGPNAGKVDVGAGLHLDQETIDAIAARRIQPLLDEINEKAEKEHARLTQLRLEAERKKDEQEREKARQKELQEINKKLKEQEKHEQKERKAEHKEELRARREEERAKRTEEKLANAELRRMGKSPELDPLSEGQQQAEEARMATVESNEGQPGRSARSSTPTRVSGDVLPTKQGQNESPKSPEEKSPKSRRVKSWFKSHFSRGSRSEDERVGRPGFIGGSALTSNYVERNESFTSADNRSASVRAVALAGRGSSRQRATSGERGPRRDKDSRGVSPVSSNSGSSVDSLRVGRESLQPGGLSPPRPIRDPSAPKSASPSRETRFHEII